MGDTKPDGAQAPRTLAQKIDHLFSAVHPPGRQYTHEEIATAIRESGGPTISGPYLWQLRKGIRDNPTKRHLEALSAFFGVPVAYFFDDVMTERIDAQLELISALRDGEVRDIALRTADLSPQARHMVADLVRNAHSMENPGQRAEPDTPE